MIHYIDEVSDLKGKKVLLRLDLNVPIIDGKVEDDYRIQRIIETIDMAAGEKIELEKNVPGIFNKFDELMKKLA